MNALQESTRATRERPKPTAPRAGESIPDSTRRIATGFASDAEARRVLTWLEAGLRPGRPGRLAAEYPLLFERPSAALAVTFFDGDRPASFCMLWPTRFELAGGTLGAAMISLVYTDPADRGRGLARDVIARAVDEARAQGIGLCLLWSELVDFYQAQGFTRAGSETLLVVERAVLQRALDPESDRSGSAGRSALGVTSARASDWPTICALREQRDCRVRLAERSTTLAGIPDLDVRVARNLEGGVIAFAMRGRGDDFAGIVHEWGGDPDGVLRCCETWLAPDETRDGLLILAPPQRSPVGWRLRCAGASVVTNPLAFFRIASASSFAREVSSLLPDFAGVGLAPLPTPREVGARFSLTSGEASDAIELSERELLHLLFSDPSKPGVASARARVAPALPASALSALPLPFFVWGLESI
jgi:GNAT superfamily N-acetyltransferase